MLEEGTIQGNLDTLCRYIQHIPTVQRPARAAVSGKGDGAGREMRAVFFHRLSIAAESPAVAEGTCVLAFMGWRALYTCFPLQSPTLQQSPAPWPPEGPQLMQGCTVTASPERNHPLQAQQLHYCYYSQHSSNKLINVVVLCPPKHSHHSELGCVPPKAHTCMCLSAERF